LQDQLLVTGDPFVSFSVSNVGGWSVGIDKSDSDSFKIANAWNDVGSNTRFVIDASGRVGIGTSNPTQNLDVIGGINATAIYVNNVPLTPGGGGGGGFSMQPGGITYTLCNTGIGASNLSARLQISAPSSAPPASNALLISNSNIKDTANSIAALNVSGGNAGNPFISFNVTNAGGWSVGIDNSDSDNFKIANTWNDLSSNTRITIDSNGRVGIGTSNPVQLLDVNGILNATGVYINNQPLSASAGGGWIANTGGLYDNLFV
jgi:hypothetical protein